MIIFLSDPNLIPYIQSKTMKSLKVFNYTSLYSGYPSLSVLVTNMYQLNNSGMPTNLFVDTVDFDVRYATMILNNDQMYEALITIMMNTYQGIDVILLVQRDPYRDALMESLIKFIQQRYGYNSWIIEDIEDISCIHEPYFSPIGIMALDEDIKRYDQLYQMGRVSSRIIDASINVE